MQHVFLDILQQGLNEKTRLQCFGHRLHLATSKLVVVELLSVIVLCVCVCVVVLYITAEII